jgi:hypothetical protein
MLSKHPKPYSFVVSNYSKHIGEQKFLISRSSRTSGSSPGPQKLSRRKPTAGRVSKVTSVVTVGPRVSGKVNRFLVCILSKQGVLDVIDAKPTLEGYVDSRVSWMPESELDAGD